VAAARVYLGIVFISAALGQFFGLAPWGPARDWPAGVARYLAQYRVQIAPFYLSFFQHVLIPHRTAVAILVPAANLIVGIILVTGWATRAAAAVALFLLANYMAIADAPIYVPFPETAYAMLALTILLANPARVWSVSHGVWRGPEVSRQRVKRWTIVPLRVYIGTCFLLETWSRVTAWTQWEAKIAGYTQLAVKGAAAFYRPFLSGIVIPHSALFAKLVFLGESAAGLSLLAGAFTPVGAFLGVVLNLNYWLSKGTSPLSVTDDLAFIAAMLVVAFTHAGRVLGVDAWLTRRYPDRWWS
jgi:uncharacterized membrane protein YphA (DoxX/SURF4 family)